MIDTVIIDAARTPIGKKMGRLAGAHPTDTLGHVIMKLLERQGLPSRRHRLFPLFVCGKIRHRFVEI